MEPGVRADAARELEAVERRHLDIGDEKIEIAFLEDPPSFLAVACDLDRMDIFFDPLDDSGAEELGILGKEDAERRERVCEGGRGREPRRVEDFVDI